MLGLPQRLYSIRLFISTLFTHRSKENGLKLAYSPSALVCFMQFPSRLVSTSSCICFDQSFIPPGFHLPCDTCSQTGSCASGVFGLRSVASGRAPFIALRNNSLSMHHGTTGKRN